MGNIASVLAAVAVGACLSVQPPINAVMARTLGSPLLAVCVSIAISLVFAIGLWLASSEPSGELAHLRALPWWVSLGGVMGVTFVVGGVMIAPDLGIALFFVCVVAGQLIGATLADHVGAFGAEVKPVNVAKLVGLALVLAGAALVRRS